MPAQAGIHCPVFADRFGGFCQMDTAVRRFGFRRHDDLTEVPFVPFGSERILAASEGIGS